MFTALTNLNSLLSNQRGITDINLSKMTEGQSPKEAEDRDARNAVTVALTDQETIAQLSSTGDAARRKRKDSVMSYEEDSKPEIHDGAIEDKENTNGVHVDISKKVQATS